MGERTATATEPPANGGTHGASERRALRRELLASIHAQGPSLIAVAGGVMVVCAGLLYGHVPMTGLWIWLAAGLVSLGLRLPVALRCRRLAADPEAALPEVLPVLLLLATGLVYGSLGLFYHAELPVIAQLVIIMFPVALTMGVVPAYGTLSPVFFAFAACALGPVLVALVAAPGTTGKLLAVPMLLFVVGEIVVVRHTGAQTRERILLRLRNDSLMTRMSARATELEAARDSARAASEAKSEFLTRMSHELRTPLNGVIGMSQLLGASKLDERQHARLDVLDDSAQALLRLVDQLLTVTRLQADELVLRPRATDLGELVTRLEASAAPRAAAAGLTLECSLDAAVPTRAELDPRRVVQVLDHLVDNAIKFSDRGGVRVRLARTQRGADEDRLLIVVEDTGIGMTPASLAQAFELFAQGDGSDSRAHGGTGLGLAIVERLVRLMGGSVEATSAPGVGTRVVVDLPLVPPGHSGDATDDEPERGASSAATRRTGRLDVLVVEDNAVNRLVIESMLAELDCRVRTANDGRQALARVAERTPDLVLMDCQMPVLDGFEATRRLREQGLSLPIVAVTANALDGDRERCIAAGMDDYLTKPLGRGALGEAIERWGGRAPAKAAA